MQIVYINDNEAAGVIFRRALFTANQSAWCEIVNDRMKTVNFVLDSTRAPDYIFIYAHFKHVPCKDLVGFIKEQSHLCNTQVIVIAEYVTLKDLQIYKNFDVPVHMNVGNLLASLTKS